MLCGFCGLFMGWGNGKGGKGAYLGVSYFAILAVAEGGARVGGGGQGDGVADGGAVAGACVEGHRCFTK